MTLTILLLAVVAAALLWSAAFTAAAVRAGPMRLLLLVIAVGVPAMLFAPAAWVAARYTVADPRAVPFIVPLAAAVFVAAIGGTVWIMAAGQRSPRGGTPPALDWPVVGLAGFAALAAFVAWGAFAIEDRAVAAAGDRWADEAARIMASNLPPATQGAATAAPLHRHAASLLAADRALRTQESPLAPSDSAGPAAAEILERHRDTLDLVRRAAAFDTCRFDRDWSRPSFSTLLPEVQSLRDEGRLLALAARRAAAEGRLAEALADTIRIHRLASHVGEQFLVTHLVGGALRSLARDTLGEVLPRLGPGDLPLLDDEAIADMAAPPPGMLVPLLGEEAMLLATYADLARSREPLRAVWEGSGADPKLDACWQMVPEAAYRVLFYREEVAAIRAAMHRFEQLAVMFQEPTGRGSAWREAVATFESDPRLIRPVARLLTPGFAAIDDVQRRSEALAGAARMAIAATRMRLATGAWPDAPEALVPGFQGSVPLDPYAAEGALKIKPIEGGIVIFSVGPDGEDNGGPPERGEFSIDPGRDDVGLWVAPRGPTAAPGAPEKAQ